MSIFAQIKVDLILLIFIIIILGEDLNSNNVLCHVYSQKDYFLESTAIID